MISPGIYKYVIDPGQTAIWLPRGARILHVHEQYGHACLWAEVDPGSPMVKRRVIGTPTGMLVPADATYVGTVHIDGGSLVFHIYDGGEI